MNFLQECKDAFDGVDRNHHGEVNIRDLIIQIRRNPAIAQFLHVSRHVQPEGNARTLQKLFNEIDTDHGCVSSSSASYNTVNLFTRIAISLSFKL